MKDARLHHSVGGFEEANANLNNLDFVAKHKERSNKYLKQVQRSYAHNSFFRFQESKGILPFSKDQTAKLNDTTLILFNNHQNEKVIKASGAKRTVCYSKRDALFVIVTACY